MTIQCDSSAPSLRHRHLCCFSAGGDESSPTGCSWLRSKAQNLPEIRDRCRRLIGRSHRKAGHGSPEFRYDPLSYALNFEDSWNREDQDEESPRSNFLARLPATPDRRKQAMLAAAPGLV
ncbi:hypothetical protein CDL15_Pgr011257 [Punica granatum]|nr:hypothetical protein CDL15_Pgr011257 [Punica granatum]PKI78299.1 hypothetical protein CRG98_001357 [Punica granatum]